MSEKQKSNYEMFASQRERYETPNTYLSDDIELPFLDALDAAGLRISEAAYRKLGTTDGVKPVYGNLFMQFSRQLTRIAYDPGAVSDLFDFEHVDVSPIRAFADVVETGIPIVDSHIDLLHQFSERSAWGIREHLRLPPDLPRERELHNDAFGACKLAERYYAKSASEGTLEYQRIVDRPYIAKLMGSQTMINLSEVSHKGVTFSPGWIFATHFNLAAASDSMPASIDGVYPIRASAFIADFPEAKQAFRTMEPWVDEQSFNYVRVHVARAQDRAS